MDFMASIADSSAVGGDNNHSALFPKPPQGFPEMPGIPRRIGRRFFINRASSPLTRCPREIQLFQGHGESEANIFFIIDNQYGTVTHANALWLKLCGNGSSEG
jgi:hypothetical protein